MYGLGLSCSAASHLLEALGVEVSKITVWRDAQEAGEALRKGCRPAGRVRVLGADETIFKLSRQEVVVGFVVDGQSGSTLGFEVHFEGDGQASLEEWLKPYAEELGARVLVTDDNESYGVAADGLGLAHQLCIAHLRKFVKRRSKSILEQAEGEWGYQEHTYEKLQVDLHRLKESLEELAEEGGKQIGRMHREYLWAQPPRRKLGKEGKANKEKASAGYRMRMLTLELWQKWKKIRLHLRRPELKLDGNNASERAIGRSKVRY